MKYKIIEPNSRLNDIWDLLIAILTIYIAIDIPLKLVSQSSRENFSIGIIITIILFIDIIKNFNTQFYYRGVLIDTREKITKYYAKKYFIFDLLAAIPFFLLSQIFPGILILKWMSLFRLFKLLRLNKIISKWRNRQAINPSILRLCFFFFWIILISHWIACIWIYIARYEGIQVIPTYIDAIYWCITTITTVGYGDISPVTDLQKILTMIAMFLGVAVYGYVIGNVASLLSNIDKTKASFLKQMEDVNSYLSYKSVPRNIKHKVHNYYQYIWHNRMVQTEQRLLANLPQSLKTDISLHIHKELIKKVPYFKQTDKDFITDIIMQIKPLVFLPGDYIVKKGEMGHCMYFISNGSVQVMSEDESSIITTLNEGDYFGEIALIKKVARTKSVKSVEFSYIYTLEKKNFDILLEKYPKFKKHIYQTISKREKKI